MSQHQRTVMSSNRLSEPAHTFTTTVLGPKLPRRLPSDARASGQYLGTTNSRSGFFLLLFRADTIYYVTSCQSSLTSLGMLDLGSSSQSLDGEEKAFPPTSWDRCERIGTVGFQETDIETHATTRALRLFDQVRLPVVPHGVMGGL
jgi:hypothetical protein